MISKKRDSFISCLSKPNYATEAPTLEKGKDPEPTGPTLYLSDVDLPLLDSDIDQTMIGEIKFIPRRISKTSEGNKIRKSFDLEIRGIKVKV